MPQKPRDRSVFIIFNIINRVYNHTASYDNIDGTVYKQQPSI